MRHIGKAIFKLALLRAVLKSVSALRTGVIRIASFLFVKIKIKKEQ